MTNRTDQERLQQALDLLRTANDNLRLARAGVNSKQLTPVRVAALVEAAKKAALEANAVLAGNAGEKRLELGPRGQEEFRTLDSQAESLKHAAAGSADYKNVLGSETTPQKTDSGTAAKTKQGSIQTSAPAARSGATPAESASRTGAPPGTSTVLANVTNAGAFSPMPRATPKYAVNNGNRSDYVDTMARLYLWLTPQEYGEYAKLAVAASHYDKRLTGLAAKLGVLPDNKSGSGYVEFLLQEAVHNHTEKVEVVETLAHKHVLYAFGAEPPTYNYAAYLLNNKQDDQAANLQRLYWTFLRAGQLAHLRTQVHLQYNEMLVSGVMTNLQLSLSANDESFQRAAFQILVRSVRMLSSRDTINRYNPGDVSLDSLTPPPEVLTVSQTQSWPSVTPVTLRQAPPTFEEQRERASLPTVSRAADGEFSRP